MNGVKVRLYKNTEEGKKTEDSRKMEGTTKTVDFSWVDEKALRVLHRSRGACEVGLTLMPHFSQPCLSTTSISNTPRISSMTARGGRANSVPWSRLKPVTQDPLEAIGLPSKGDNRYV